MKYGLPALGLSALVGLGTVVAATPARAATTTTTGTVALGRYLEFKAAAGAKNSLVVTRTGDVFTFDDTVALRAGQGCRAVSGHRTIVTCAVADPGPLIITLGDKNDTFVNGTGRPLNVYGGPGNDTLTGGPARERLDGGTGQDKLYAGAGNDQVRGRAGDDLNGGPGKDVYWAGGGFDTMVDADGSSDVFHGGADSDEVDYSGRLKPIVADADGVTGDDGQAGEKDTIGADVERLVGGERNDRLTGDDRLYGLVELDGGPPPDPDTVGDSLGASIDGGADTDLCAPGRAGTGVHCETAP